MQTAKSYDISKQTVWKAYKRVKANKGAAGVDAVTMKDFEENLKDNLYKIWNRLSSGSYFPPPVRVVEIPKATGGTRQLGVPTVLELHPAKTKIVYCKDDDRRGTYDNEQFDFLGYTFRIRKVKARSGKFFAGFNPAISNRAIKSIRQRISNWCIQRWTTKSINEIASMFRAVIRGWLNYYGKYYKSKLFDVLRHIDQMLIKWALKKYKRLKGSRRKAYAWLSRVASRNPGLFPHWTTAR